MSSIAEQVITSMVAALLNRTGAQDRVFRTRAIAIAHEEAPSIVVKPATESTAVFGNSVDSNVLTVTVSIHTRGDPADQLADPLVTQAHALLMKSPDLSSIITAIRRKERDWEQAEADDTAGWVTLKYEVRYLCDANDLSLQV